MSRLSNTVKTDYLVTGYVKCYFITINNNVHNYYPSSLIKEFSKFLGNIFMKFDPDLIGKALTLVNEYHVVNSRHTDWNTAWLTPSIKAGNHCWKFEIKSNSNKTSTCCIGLFKAEYASCTINTHLACGENMGYAFFWKYGKIMDHTSGCTGKDYGKKCKAGDTIDMY
eukprot:221490_1